MWNKPAHTQKRLLLVSVRSVAKARLSVSCPFRSSCILRARVNFIIWAEWQNQLWLVVDQVSKISGCFMFMFLTDFYLLSTFTCAVKLIYDQSSISQITVPILIYTHEIDIDVLTDESSLHYDRWQDALFQLVNIGPLPVDQLCHKRTSELAS